MTRIINPRPRTVMLSTREVAEREGVSISQVRSWCRKGAIWPVMRLGATWLIEPLYVAAPPNLQPGRPRSALPKVPSERGRGRPKGVKNSRPYPKGVKRPRRKDK